MAKVTVMDINPNTVSKLMTVKFLAHLEFKSDEDLAQAIFLGFDPEQWKRKNSQRIYVRRLIEV